MEKVISALGRQLKKEESRPEKDQDEDYIDQLKEALRALNFYVALTKFINYD